MKLWILVILVAVLLIFAITLFYRDEVKTVTAKEYYDYVISLAVEWNSDAKLRALSSSEGGKSNIGCAIDSSNDPIIGDGKTVFWCYVFSSESKNKSYVISIDSDMKLIVTYEYEGSVAWYSSNIGVDHDMTISNWTIDSDIALEKVLENDDEFSDFISTYNNNATIKIILRDLEVNNTQTEYWYIWYYCENVTDLERVLVDASDGTVLKFEDLDWIH